MVALEHVMTDRDRQALEEKAHAVFSEYFPGSRAEIGWTPYGEVLSGFLGWDGFCGVESLDAVQMVKRAVRAGFTPDEQRHIVGVIPMPMSALLDHLEPLD